MVLSGTRFVSALMVATRTTCRALAAWAALTLLGPVALEAQSTARVRTEENVRREPNGEIVARLSPGALLPVVGRQDRWIQVDVEGWVWERSLQATSQAGFDLVVSPAEGENLRAAPSGDIVGRVGRGTFLEELERRPGWIRVRRRAWIWAESVLETTTPAATAPAPSPAAGGGSAAASPGPGAAARAPSVSVGAPGTPLLSAPNGDTLARTLRTTDLEVVAREGNWARVRLEGWVWLPRQGPAASPSGDAAAGTPLTPRDLAADPTGHHGRMVTWELQYISTERAEKVRTDFFEGEPFLLTRYGGGDGPFVYVAVPTERVTEFQGLVPLERLQVTGRVRTGASSLTGTPIVDLVALERLRTPR